jgi:hypothetical protein
MEIETGALLDLIIIIVVNIVFVALLVINARRNQGEP